MDYGIGAATVEIDVDVAFCHESRDAALQRTIC